MWTYAANDSFCGVGEVPFGRGTLLSLRCCEVRLSVGWRCGDEVVDPEVCSRTTLSGDFIIAVA